VEVRGKTSAARPWREAVVASVRDNPAIAAAWARGQVRQLEDCYAAGASSRSGLEQTIIATSLRFGVLCRFTAYVAIDRAAVVNEGGEVHQITQPVEMPAGWGQETLLYAACASAPSTMRVGAVNQSMAIEDTDHVSMLRSLEPDEGILRASSFTTTNSLAIPQSIRTRAAVPVGARRSDSAGGIYAVREDRRG